MTQPTERPKVPLLERIALVFLRIVAGLLILALLSRSAKSLVDHAIIFPRQRADSAAELERALSILPDAQSRWDAHPIADYDITLRLSIDPICFIGPAVVEVRSGNVENGADFTHSQQEFESCHVSAWLPGASFETLSTTLAKHDPQTWALKVQFDPDYGFVSLYQTSAIDGAGNTSVILTDFKPAAR